MPMQKTVLFLYRLCAYVHMVLLYCREEHLGENLQTLFAPGAINSARNNHTGNLSGLFSFVKVGKEIIE